MQVVAALEFADLVHVVNDCARKAGLIVPTWQSPPRIAGVDRSIRRREGLPATVAVRFKDRQPVAVILDMTEGLIAANNLDPTAPATLATRSEIVACAIAHINPAPLAGYTGEPF